MNEADTCRTYVLPKLKSAGWEDEFITEQLVLTPGRIAVEGQRAAGVLVPFVTLRGCCAIRGRGGTVRTDAVVLDRAFKGEL